MEEIPEKPDNRLPLVLRIAAMLPCDHREALTILEALKEQLADFYASGGFVTL